MGEYDTRGVAALPVWAHLPALFDGGARGAANAVRSESDVVRRVALSCFFFFLEKVYITLNL